MRDRAGAKVWLVADDYGLSPAVSLGIRELIASERISGTGCMTLFPEWRAAADELKQVAHLDKSVIGLHLTLTDFQPLTGTSKLAPDGMLPGLKNLIVATKTGRALDAAIHAELDAQLDEFVTVMGHAPHYLDGHQHVHFLPPVRSWLKAKAAALNASGTLWIRGAPSVRLASSIAMKAKISFVAGLALGFNTSMKRAGYTIAGPLSGFYDWSRPEAFEPALQDVAKRAQNGSVVMCHPGHLDDVLKSRDSLVAARQAEWDVLMRSSGLEIMQRSQSEDVHAG